METLERLGPDHLRAVATGYRDALRSHQETLNNLNVYPVPDGDTGTNMALTMESVVAALDSAVGMASVCQAISHGSLMGARGNSGVILSQVLRGLADGVKGLEAADGSALAEALAQASDAAYAAVMRPVEGTILTVVREAAEAAGKAAAGGHCLVDVLDAANAAGRAALARTPELLPKLAEHGVVDAGGAGFNLLLDAFLYVSAGRPMPEPPPAIGLAGAASQGPAWLAGPTGSGNRPDSAASGASGQGAGVSRTPAGDVSELRYEVMYFLEAPDTAIPAFKDVWNGLGDSIVVVGGGGIWNCHIHTDDIGGVIEAALDCGRPRDIRVTDLLEQVEEERWVREAPPEAPVEVEPMPTAVVAVATGEGIKRIFRSLGVQQVVAGGQSMNPSTAQLLQAVQAAPGEGVIILPNNKNIIPVAEQVDELSEKTVRVLATAGITEGFAALMEYDPQADVDENLVLMTEAAGRIVSGEVTRAVRDSIWPGGHIKEGDYIGLATTRGILSVAASLDEAAIGLLAALVAEGNEIVTIIEGEGASTAVTRRIREWLAEHRPGVTPEIHHGGQPLYPYLFGVE